MTEPTRRAGLLKPGVAWLLLALLLALGAVVTWFAEPTRWDWQPALAWSQPWRWWSAAFVHLTLLHLLANLLATALVAAYGWAARVPAVVALAWFAAWPVTQLGLLAKPELLHYAGLSGVLHAGVAATTLWLVLRTRGARRRIGWMMLAGQSVKLLIEQPWGAAVLPPGELDVPVAPLAHAVGTLAGALFCVLALLLARARKS